MIFSAPSSPRVTTLREVQTGTGGLSVPPRAAACASVQQTQVADSACDTLIPRIFLRTSLRP